MAHGLKLHTNVAWRMRGKYRRHSCMRARKDDHREKISQVLHPYQPPVCEHMPAMEPPAEELQGALQKLETLQQQQQESAAGLQLLATQHRDWQAAVAELLGQVESSLRDDASDSTRWLHARFARRPAWHSRPAPLSAQYVPRSSPAS